MKYIWEEDDFKSSSGNWGLMATKREEVVIIGGLGVTSLRDGHHWTYSDAKKMSESFNENGYVPVLAPVNPSFVIKNGISNNWNYGDLFNTVK